MCGCPAALLYDAGDEIAQIPHMTAGDLAKFMAQNRAGGREPAPAGAGAGVDERKSSDAWHEPSQRGDATSAAAPATGGAVDASKKAGIPATIAAPAPSSPHSFHGSSSVVGSPHSVNTFAKQRLVSDLAAVGDIHGMCTVLISNMHETQVACHTLQTMAALLATDRFALVDVAKLAWFGTMLDDVVRAHSLQPSVLVAVARVVEEAVSSPTLRQRVVPAHSAAGAQSSQANASDNDSDSGHDKAPPPNPGTESGADAPLGAARHVTEVLPVPDAADPAARGHVLSLLLTSARHLQASAPHVGFALLRVLLRMLDAEKGRQSVGWRSVVLALDHEAEATRWGIESPVLRSWTLELIRTVASDTERLRAGAESCVGAIRYAVSEAHAGPGGTEPKVSSRFATAVCTRLVALLAWVERTRMRVDIGDWGDALPNLVRAVANACESPLVRPVQRRELMVSIRPLRISEAPRCHSMRLDVQALALYDACFPAAQVQQGIAVTAGWRRLTKLRVDTDTRRCVCWLGRRACVLGPSHHLASPTLLYYWSAGTASAKMRGGAPCVRCGTRCVQPFVDQLARGSSRPARPSKLHSRPSTTLISALGWQTLSGWSLRARRELRLINSVVANPAALSPLWPCARCCDCARTSCTRQRPRTSNGIGFKPCLANYGECSVSLVRAPGCSLPY